MNWVAAFGFVLSVGYSVPNVIQLIRTLQVRNAFGWNSQLVLAWMISYTAWAIYSGIVVEPMLVVVNLIGVIMMFAILFYLVKEGKVSARQWIGWGLWAVVLIGLGVFWLPALLPILGTVADIAVLVPQTLSVIRDKQVDGMSVSFFSIAIVLGAGWIVYSFLVGKPLLGIYHYFGLPWNVWMFWRIRGLQQNQLAVVAAEERSLSLASV